ncbi:MAG: M23 family metallopeptidase [Nocardioidaceae bacterium]
MNVMAALLVATMLPTLPAAPPASRFASPAASAAAAVAPAVPPGAPAPPAPSSGVWPLDPQPQVDRGFDPPADPWGAGHRGVDLRGHVGQPVRAAESGVVRFVGRIAGRGIVVVDHGGTRTTYEPVQASVAVGDRVAAGAVIGSLELFGSHCFPAACLHWGLIEGASTYLDPLTLVGAGPVRLLPLDGLG